MSEQAVVLAFNPSSGALAVQQDDGRCVLAELTGAGQPQTGQRLQGEMRSFGAATWSEVQGAASFEVFVTAWDLSAAAIELEFR